MSSPPPGLHPAVKYGLLAVLAGLLIYNVVVRGDPALSLLIAGGLITTLGLDQNARKGE